MFDKDCLTTSPTDHVDSSCERWFDKDCSTTSPTDHVDSSWSTTRCAMAVTVWAVWDRVTVYIDESGYPDYRRQHRIVVLQLDRQCRTVRHCSPVWVWRHWSLSNVSWKRNQRWTLSGSEVTSLWRKFQQFESELCMAWWPCHLAIASPVMSTAENLNDHEIWKKLPTFFFARRCASAVYGMADLCLFVRLFVCLPVASRYSIKTAKRHHIYERRMIVQGLCFSEV